MQEDVRFEEVTLGSLFSFVSVLESSVGADFEAHILKASITRDFELRPYPERCTFTLGNSYALDDSF